jgi:hypothetical protein
VSTTTFVRYFHTMADTVTDNGFTPLFLAAFAAQPAELTRRPPARATGPADQRPR